MKGSFVEVLPLESFATLGLEFYARGLSPVFLDAEPYGRIYGQRFIGDSLVVGFRCGYVAGF